MKISAKEQYYDYQYHYSFHTGEAHAIRQQLGQPDLPQFVGDMSKVLYQAESGDA
jgi:hypothetical protein